MRRACLNVLLIASLFSLVFIPNSIVAEKKQRKLPQSGVLAGSMDTGAGSSSVPGVWGADTGMSDGGGSPVSASVSRDQRNWILKVFNNSKDKFSVNLQVVQFGKNQREITSVNILLNLKAEQSVERKIKTHPLATNAVVRLKNHKRTAKKASKGELKRDIMTKKKELKRLEAQLKGLE